MSPTQGHAHGKQKQPKFPPESMLSVRERGEGEGEWNASVGRVGSVILKGLHGIPSWEGDIWAKSCNSFGEVRMGNRSLFEQRSFNCKSPKAEGKKEQGGQRGWPSWSRVTKGRSAGDEMRQSFLARLQRALKCSEVLWLLAWWVWEEEWLGLNFYSDHYSCCVGKRRRNLGWKQRNQLEDCWIPTTNNPITATMATRSGDQQAWPPTESHSKVSVNVPPGLSSSADSLGRIRGRFWSPLMKCVSVLGHLVLMKQ